MKRRSKWKTDHIDDINRPRSRHGKRELEMLPKAFIFTMLLSKKQKKKRNFISEEYMGFPLGY